MATTAPTLDGSYDLDKAHSTVQFAVRHLTVSTFRASFGDVDGRLTIEDGVAGLAARAVVESISITDPPEFREHIIRGQDFFAADDYPLITFRSTGVDLDDRENAIVSGELTIRGITRTVTARGSFDPPTEDPFGGHRAGLSLTATIDRKDWGLDWQAPLPNGEDAVGWDVEISAYLELTRIG